MLLNFTKMEGTGNDFVVVDARTQPVTLDAQQIRILSDRRTGIGFDQLLLIEAASLPAHHCAYRIFNADGQSVQQCGNGARALAAYVGAALPPANPIHMESPAGVVHAEVLPGDLVRVNMGVPEFDPAALPFSAPVQATEYVLDTESQCVEFGAVSLGNPHAVIPVTDVDQAPVETVGALLQKHPAFPESVNVGFAQVLNPGALRLRVYERGVGETLACGTGACAAAAVCQMLGQVGKEVRILMRGGELLVSWAGDGQTIWLTGSCNRVFEGQIEL